jgi:hypothetical protein
MAFTVSTAIILTKVHMWRKPAHGTVPCLKFKKHLEKVKQKLKALAIFKAAGLHWCQERSNHTEWPRELSSVNTQGLDYFFWLTYTE